LPLNEEMLRKKLGSMFLEEGFNLSREALYIILSQENPLGFARAILKKAKANAHRPGTITSDYLEGLKAQEGFDSEMTDEEFAELILGKLEKNALFRVCEEAQQAMKVDSLVIYNKLNLVWRKGLLPLHMLEAYYYLEFLTDTKLQETYK